MWRVHIMKRAGLLILAFVLAQIGQAVNTSEEGISAVGMSEAQEGGSAAALTRLRGLAGEWEGSFEWTGARTATGRISATYSETGNGSAVVENLAVDGVPSMTSVYHLDSGDLRMTHYCAAQNQPRLKARQIDIAKGILDFEFLDATNLRSPDSPHVSGLELRLLNAHPITFSLPSEACGKASQAATHLKRVGPRPSPR